jgi:hypothetical protein
MIFHIGQKCFSILLIKSGRTTDGNKTHSYDVWARYTVNEPTESVGGIEGQTRGGACRWRMHEVVRRFALEGILGSRTEGCRCPAAASCDDRWHLAHYFFFSFGGSPPRSSMLCGIETVLRLFDVLSCDSSWDRVGIELFHYHTISIFSLIDLERIA